MKNKINLHVAQGPIYYHQQINPKSTLYNIGGYIKFKGKGFKKDVYIDVLKKFSVLFDVFNIEYEFHKEKAFCKLTSIKDIFVSEKDFSSYANPQKEALIWMQQVFNTPFNLDDNRFYRMSVIKIADDEYWWLPCFFHLIIDGYGYSALVKHIVKEYRTISQNLVVESQVDSKSYFDIIKKSNEYVLSEDYQKDSDYWKNQYNTIPDSIFYKKNKINKTNGGRISIVISEKKRSYYAKLSKDFGVNLQQLTLAVLAIYYGKTANYKEFSVGIPVHNRGNRKERNILGMFANVLAFKNEYNPELTLVEFINKIKQKQRQDYKYRQYPIDHFNRELKLFSEKRTQLFDIIVNYEPFMLPQTLDLGIKMEVKHLASTQEYPCPLSFRWCEYGDDQPLELKIDYDGDYLNEEEVTLLSKRLLFILDLFEENQNKLVSEIPIITKKEQEQLKVFNDTKVIYPSNKTLINAFVEQTAKSGNSIAIIYKDNSLTYSELNDISNQLAHYLLSNYTVKTEDLIAVELERSEWLIISLLAILKTGGVYLPIDPNYPKQRINYIKKDSRCELSIDKSLIEDFKRSKNKYNVKCPNVKISPVQLAYVIYTSGSTGKPKGVLIENQGIINTIISQIENFKIKKGHNCLQFSNQSFDASIWEIFISILSGATLHIVEEAVKLDIDNFIKYIQDHKITFATLPPSYLNLIDCKLISTIKTLVTAGEQAPLEKAKTFSALGGTYINAYGPTETSICATTFTGEGASFVPIGKPISNTTIYILNELNELLPIGNIGELCVSGIGVARGYLNRAKLTDEKFISNPFKKGERLYKTGDLARWLPDGNIEFIGRKDDQIKIRGHRIELGEIESVLNQLDVVQQAVVLLNENTTTQQNLVAYIVAVNDFDSQKVQQELESKLPEYMIPRLYVQLTKLPITSNGKIDKKALNELDDNRCDKVEREDASNEKEFQMVKIWKELLNIKGIGIHDNFFDLGGNSINAIQLVSRSKRIGINYTVTDIFNYQTIAAISSRASINSYILKEDGFLEGIVPLHPIQLQFFEKKYEVYNHYNQSVLLTISKEVNKDILSRALNLLTTQHDALRLYYSDLDKETPIQKYGANRTSLLEDTIETLSQLPDTCNKYQSNLDIKTGNIAQYVWIKTPEKEPMNRLFLAVHHLSIDGVSWRILIEDLESILKNNKKTIDALESKGTSYRQWTTKLQEYATSKAVDLEYKYWNNKVSLCQKLNRKTFENLNSLYKNIKTQHHFLNKSDTTYLITKVNQIYGTKINDILLSALSLALANIIDSDKIIIGLEGHGREELFDDIDLSKTVGWFTSLFPICLDLSKSENTIISLIADTKDMLREIPKKGIGYGVLRYLSTSSDVRSNLSKPFDDIVFNYLGSFDNSFSENKLLGISKENKGQDISSLNKTNHKLVIDCMIIEGVFQINMNYDTDYFDDKMIETLADSYCYYLQKIISISKNLILREEQEFEISFL